MTGPSSDSALQVSDNFLLFLNMNRFPFEDVPFPFCIAKHIYGALREMNLPWWQVAEAIAMG